MSSTNYRWALMAMVLAALVLGGCSVVDTKSAGLSSQTYTGPYASGKSSHSTLYTDHIAPKTTDMVYSHKNLYVEGDLYVRGKFYPNSDALTRTVYSSESVQGDGKQVKCGISETQPHLQRCDVLVYITDSVAPFTESTAAGFVTFGMKKGTSSCNSNFDCSSEACLDYAATGTGICGEEERYCSLAGLCFQSKSYLAIAEVNGKLCKAEYDADNSVITLKTTGLQTCMMTVTKTSLNTQ